MYFTRVSSFILFGFAVIGCSSSSSGPAAPVIDNLVVADTATVGPVPHSTQQAYDIKGTISFHDDSESITEYLIHVDVPGATVPDQKQGIPATTKTVGQAFDLYLDSSAPKGAITLTTTVYGASGKASASIQSTVTLQ